MSRAAKPSPKTPELGESSLLLPLCPSFQGSDHLGGCREDVEGKVITVFYLIGANIALSSCCLPRGKHRILGYVTYPHEHSSEGFVGDFLNAWISNVECQLCLDYFWLFSHLQPLELHYRESCCWITHPATVLPDSRLHNGPSVVPF